MSEPVCIRNDEETSIDLVVEWPNIPLEELGSYGTISPSNEGDNEVKGELYEVQDPSIIDYLDEYEGNEYLKEEVPILDTSQKH